MYGALESSASRIFLPTDSLRSSTRGRKPASLELGGHLSSALVVPVGDREDDRLHRSQPEGEPATVVLDQDPRETLHRAEQRPVDHHGPMLGIVRAGVVELEALGHLEVELAGSALPGAPQGVGDVEVDLRPVERALAGADVVLAPLSRKRLAESVLGPLPLLIGADRLVGAGRELDPRLVETEALVELVDARADRVDLVGHLIERAVDVRVVLGEGAHPEQPMQDSLPLIARDEPELGQPQRQLSVGVAAGGEDEAGARAVHRLERVLALLPGASRSDGAVKNMFSL